MEEQLSGKLANLTKLTIKTTLCQFSLAYCRMRMDDTDRRLIGLLRENARLPVATLARRLKVSRGTVQNRIDRLTANAAISGFTVRLRPDVEPHRVRAITMVAVDGEHANAVLKSLRNIPEVQALHTTNGRWDIVVELGVESLEAFDQALQRIRLIKGISSSETSLLLSTHKI
jgi:DNA-binding Lrp family transcriptional regulator